MERMVVVQASCYGEDNRRTIDAVQELGVHRARGVVMVGANITERELSAMHDKGVRATRFITMAKGGPTLDQLNEVAARVAPFGWAVEMYIPTSAWPEVLPVVERLPVPVVFDHMGGMMADTPPDDPVFKRIIALLESGRCWTKLTGYRPSVAGPPVRRRGTARALHHRARAGPLRVGLGLAAHQHRGLHARRRRPSRPARHVGGRRRDACEDPRRQPGGTLRLLVWTKARRSAAPPDIDRSTTYSRKEEVTHHV